MCEVPLYWKVKFTARGVDLSALALWCFGALYETHIVAPRTPNSYGVIHDKLRMGSLTGAIAHPDTHRPRVLRYRGTSSIRKRPPSRTAVRP